MLTSVHSGCQAELCKTQIWQGHSPFPSVPAAPPLCRKTNVLSLDTLALPSSLKLGTISYFLLSLSALCSPPPFSNLRTSVHPLRLTPNVPLRVSPPRSAKVSILSACPEPSPFLRACSHLSQSWRKWVETSRSDPCGQSQDIVMKVDQELWPVLAAFYPTIQ